MTLTTTLNQIRAHKPCVEGWKTLLHSLGKTAPDNEPLPLEHILDSNGLQDTLWCLRTLPDPNISKKINTHLALAFANQVRHLMRDKRSTDALDIATAFVENRASRDELRQAQQDALAANRIIYNISDVIDADPHTVASVYASRTADYAISFTTSSISSAAYVTARTARTSADIAFSTYDLVTKEYLAKNFIEAQVDIMRTMCRTN